MIKMNKDEKVLKSALNALISRLERVEAFAISQAPSICKEIIAEQTIKYTMRLIFNLILVIIFGLGGIVAISYALKQDLFGFQAILGVLGAIAVGLCVCGLLESVENIKDLIITRYCPKLVILKQLRGIVRND